MLSYQIGDGKITFRWDDDETVSGYRTWSTHAPTWIEVSELKAIAEVVKLLCVTVAERSYSAHFLYSRCIFDHVAKLRIKFPPADDGWNNFIVTHYATHLTDISNKPKTRFAQWSGIANLYKALRRAGVIPINTFIPDASAKGVGQPEAMAQPHGYGTVQTSIPKSTRFLLPKKFLVEEGMSLEDDVYLLNLKNTLEMRAGAIVDYSVDYWDRMLRCHARGDELCKDISVDQIKTMLENKFFYNDGIHLAHPDAPTGLNWFLAVTRYYAEQTDELKSVTFSELKKLPFFKPVIYNCTSKPKLVAGLWAAAGDDGVANYNVNETFNRLLGYLSPRDCAVASAIIASENPNFNPSSLTNIRLYRQDGKFYLRGNSDTKRITISVSKSRARSRKLSVLPPLSTKIVMDVIRCTSMPRRRLVSEGKSGWRKLFLISSRKQIGSNPDFTKTLATHTGLSFYDIYKEELEAVGVAQSMMSLYTIRCTQGLLEFLRSGSLQAVADLLGNSLHVVRRNYIPPWMIHRWAVRFFRILHQKIMLVATEGEPWQLAASDFTSREELQTFVRRVLLGLKSGDPLSQALREKLGHYTPDPSSLLEMFLERELLFDRTPNSLAAIYAYAEAVDELQPEDRLLFDEGTNVPLWVFTTIRDLVVKTISVDFDSASNAEMAIADRVSGDSMSELRQSHARATILKKDLRPLVSILNGRAT
ncbi:hypothetical protein [Pseudomonas sp. AL03]|uniref:hypothetical protein n=1 Tax=Pseudomonas sp. AL03 TaxID=3042230 RepID=UPI00249CD4DA|nr:hypothetical protein [Pseudomonas sp. AL03]MDI3275778.1 hypothetical protein [Pseudomonas sp. AL03]